jgi:hypothetical protein
MVQTTDGSNQLKPSDGSNQFKPSLFQLVQTTDGCNRFKPLMVHTSLNHHSSNRVQTAQLEAGSTGETVMAQTSLNPGVSLDTMWLKLKPCC